MLGPALVVVATGVFASILVISSPSAAAQGLVNSECYALADNAPELYVLELDTLNPGPAS